MCMVVYPKFSMCHLQNGFALISYYSTIFTKQNIVSIIKIVIYIIHY